MSPGFAAWTWSPQEPPRSPGMETGGRDYLGWWGGRRRGGEAGETSVARQGLSRSTETVSCRPPTWRVKNLGPLASTWYGPSYSVERGGPGAPCRTKTKEAEARPLGGSGDGWETVMGLVGMLVGHRRRFSRKEAVGGSEVSSSSPDNARGTPYSSSAADRLWSSLGAARRPRMIQGRCAGQSLAASQARMESLCCRWKCSTKPLACGW